MWPPLTWFRPFTTQFAPAFHVGTSSRICIFRNSLWNFGSNTKGLCESFKFTRILLAITFAANRNSFCHLKRTFGTFVAYKEALMVLISDILPHLCENSYIWQLQKFLIVVRLHSRYPKILVQFFIQQAYILNVSVRHIIKFAGNMLYNFMYVSYVIFYLLVAPDHDLRFI